MAQVLSAFHLHPWSSSWLRTLLDSTSPLSTSSSSSCLSPSSSSTSSCSLSSSTRRTWQTCAAPRRTRVRTLGRLPPSTGYEPKAHDFDELYDSSVPFSLMIPSADQDVDDLTLGEMLTQAYRGQVDYCVPGGMSVSQSSSSVMFDGSGQPDGERMVDRSGQPDELNVNSSF